LDNGKWSAPELAPFSGSYFDKEPFVAPDGKELFFSRGWGEIYHILTKQIPTNLGRSPGQ
jgi:hypothetical protein